jgi:hypothetical protein
MMLPLFAKFFPIMSLFCRFSPILALFRKILPILPLFYKILQTLANFLPHFATPFFVPQYQCGQIRQIIAQ